MSRGASGDRRTIPSEDDREPDCGAGWNWKYLWAELRWQVEGEVEVGGSGGVCRCRVGFSLSLRREPGSVAVVPPCQSRLAVLLLGIVVVKVKTKTISKKEKTPSLERLLEAGVHFGHLVRRWHPKMAAYIFTTRGKMHIFDLVKTREKLIEAEAFLEKVAAKGGKIVFVGTKRQARPIVKAAAEDCGAFYVISRWLGGTLTNFESIKGNMDRLKELEAGLSGGRFNHYTKKERLQIQRKIAKLEKLVGGIRDLDRLPDALFIVDPRREKTALAEAGRCNIPVVALLDTNCDPTPVAYPIPGNDDAARSVEIVVKAVAAAVKAGYKKKPSS